MNFLQPVVLRFSTLFEFRFGMKRSLGAEKGSRTRRLMFFSSSLANKQLLYERALTGTFILALSCFRYHLFRSLITIVFALRVIVWQFYV